MKILCVCEQGNNRSVTIAHHVKYLGHDVLSAGLNTNAPETLRMLFDWSERIITTDHTQSIPIEHRDKTTLWDVGADTYPRPFNRDLMLKVRKLVERHRGDL